jgi:hypothetical protein
MTDSIWNWLTSEAGAGWVFGFVALAALVFTIVTRNRPRRAIAKEIHRISLVQIREGVKDRIKVRFDNKQVKNLAGIVFELTNTGSQPISNFSFRMTFPDSVKILSLFSPSTGHGANVTTNADKNVGRVQMSYLNPYREHKQAVFVTAIIDGTVHECKISGGGEGWSLKHVPYPNPQALQRKLRFRALFGIPAILVLAYAYDVWVVKGLLHLETTAQSLSLFFASLPVALVLYLLFELFIKQPLSQLFLTRVTINRDSQQGAPA